MINREKLLKRMGVTTSEIDCAKLELTLANGSTRELKNPRVVKAKCQGTFFLEINPDEEDISGW